MHYWDIEVREQIRVFRSKARRLLKEDFASRFSPQRDDEIAQKCEHHLTIAMRELELNCSQALELSEDGKAILKGYVKPNLGIRRNARNRISYECERFAVAGYSALYKSSVEKKLHKSKRLQKKNFIKKPSQRDEVKLTAATKDLLAFLLEHFFGIPKGVITREFDFLLHNAAEEIANASPLRTPARLFQKALDKSDFVLRAPLVVQRSSLDLAIDWISHLFKS